MLGPSYIFQLGPMLSVTLPIEFTNLKKPSNNCKDVVAWRVTYVLEKGYNLPNKTALSQPNTRVFRSLGLGEWEEPVISRP